MMNQFVHKITLKDYKVFLLFLSLTLILWFIIQMTRFYKQETQVIIEIDNVPNHIVLDSTKIVFPLKISTSGFNLWKFNLASDQLKLDFNTFEKDSTTLNMSTYKIASIIAKQNKFDADDIQFENSVLSFIYKKKATKLVAIKPEIEISYENGYNSIDVMKFEPDSIVISGAKNDLKDIEFIKTKKLKLDNINETLAGKVELIIPHKNISISKEFVNYYLPVTKFSEKTLIVDFSIINVPDSVVISVFPNKAKLSFLTSLEMFEKISADDFNVICDYSERYESDAILIPKIDKYPSDILNPKLHINKVDYIIKRK